MTAPKIEEILVELLELQRELVIENAQQNQRMENRYASESRNHTTIYRELQDRLDKLVSASYLLYYTVALGGFLFFTNFIYNFLKGTH